LHFLLWKVALKDALFEESQLNPKFWARILVVFVLGLGGFAQAQMLLNASPDTKWLRKELKRMDLPSNFVTDVLHDYQTESFEPVLRMNLLGFLKPPQHMDLVTPEAVTEASRFLKENRKDFEQAQNRYQVSPDVISALLWIETRHGDNLGQYHIVSVFLHLLQTDRPAIREKLTAMAIAQNKSLKEYSAGELKKVMRERTKRKAKWAADEIRALASIYKKGQLNLHTLRGSYAGAFGLSQFLPSSYRDYARSAKDQGNPNLMKPGDAIISVAHYLSRHGWKNQKSNRKVKALMSYNNSRDYADSILEISKRVASKNRNSSSNNTVTTTKTPG
jgi:membrane-bound lytic murein transglycosylase B